MRRNPTSNLAFIDIMSCGLGAVILILVLLKNQQVTPNELAALDHAALDQQIEALLKQKEANAMAVQDEQSALSKLNQQITDLRARQAVIATIKTNTLSAIERLQRKIKESEQKLNELTAEQTINPIATQNRLQEDYLVGLNVEGKRIAVLVDSSASMTARELIAITNYKVQSDAKRRTAAKWQRTLRIFQWLIARAPEDSELLVMSFSNQATVQTKPNWIPVRDQQALAVMQKAMLSVTPYGATNLEKAVTKVLKQRPDVIYLITDGLPTQGLNQASILSSGGCGGMTALKKTVSGECRVTLLQQAASLTNSFRGKLSVILLPLEGDPQAAPEFSKWVLSTGGTLISPAATWP